MAFKLFDSRFIVGYSKLNGKAIYLALNLELSKTVILFRKLFIAINSFKIIFLILQDKLYRTITEELGNLDNNCPAHVEPWEDALIWIQNRFDNLDKCMGYFTLILCIMTQNLLDNRFFADAAFIECLESKKDVFIPIYVSKDNYQSLSKSGKLARLPSIYKTVKPLYLDDINIIRNLKKLFNFHLNKKLKREEDHDAKIDDEYRVIRQYLGITDGNTLPHNSVPTFESDSVSATDEVTISVPPDTDTYDSDLCATSDQQSDSHEPLLPSSWFTLRSIKKRITRCFHWKSVLSLSFIATIGTIFIAKYRRWAAN